MNISTATSKLGAQRHAFAHPGVRKSAACAAFLALLLAGCERNSDTATTADSTAVEPSGEAMAPASADRPAEPSDVAAIAQVQATEGYAASGEVRFHLVGDNLRITGELTGLKPGSHGFHIHEVGDCSAPDAASASGHFAPDGDSHGSPYDDPDQHHVGDLGNIYANSDGRASIDIEDSEMSLDRSATGIIGKSVIVHAGHDDLESQPSGDAGARAGCGVIRELQLDRASS